jgi:adenylosuccinate synthase
MSTMLVKPEIQLPDYPLDGQESQILAAYNTRVAQGVMHTEIFQAEMARLQRRVDRWEQQCARIRRANPWVKEASRGQL